MIWVIKKFGWAASKTFFALQANSNDMFLLLDSDIVFVEPFLERVLREKGSSDVIVSVDNYVDMFDDYVTNTYFDVRKVLAFDSDYEQPAYYFNTGQLFLRGGSIKQSQLAPFLILLNFLFGQEAMSFP